ncbi:MAG: peptidylprolyl isomerase, partial [Pseudomonadota bacterium]
MLGSLRTSGKGKSSKVFIWVIMAFLGLGLVAYAFVGVATGIAGTNVASVGSEKVERESYLRVLQSTVNGMSRQFGIPLTMQQARAFGIDQQVLGQLITQAALVGEAKRLGISAGDEAVREELLARPDFQGSGGFNPATYQYVLEQSGLSAPEYEEQVREDLARTILEAGVSGGVIAPPLMAETMLRHEGEERRFSYALLTARNLPEPVGEPSAEDLRQFYEENPEAYTLPEARVVTYIALTPADMAAEVEIMEYLNSSTTECYEMRFRNKWDEPDSVYDAWLLLNNNTRMWLDHERFLSLYKDWGTLRLQFYAKLKEQESSTKRKSFSKRNL